MTDLSSRRRHQSMVVAALVALVVGLLGAPVALAQDDEPAVAPVLLSIDDRGDDPAFVVRTAEQPSQISVAVNDIPVDADAPASLSAAGIGVRTMIVIDNSAQAADLLPSFVAAAVDYVDRAPSSEDVGIWTTGGAARVRVGLNNQHDRTRGILEALVTSSGPSHLWDGIRGAALDFEDTLPGATNLLVFAASDDTDSVSSPIEARAAVGAANASAFVVAHDDPNENLSVLGPLTRLAAETPGGAYAASDDDALLAGYGSSISGVVASTWYVGFDDPEATDANQMAITIDGVTIRASFVPDAITTGSALAPFEDNSGGGLPFLEGDNGRTIGLFLGAVAAGLLAYSIAMLLQKDESGLNSVLQPYADPYAQTPEEGEKGGFAANALLKRAVEITEGFAERQGMLARAEGALERANVPLRAGEAMTAYVGIFLASLVIGLFLGGTIISAAIFGVLGLIVPPAFVNFRAGRRKKAFMSQLPDTLQLLSSTLKAGYSFMQGVEAVSQEVEDPMGGELRRIVTEAQLGRPLEEAMDASAERMDSPDFAWAVMAVKIQREVGGNLSELLLTVAETMTARERLRRDVSALTAEGKMSAMVLGALPILLGMAMWAINPDYINTLFEETIGKVILGMSIVAALIGFAWMKKIITIDI